MTLSLTKPDSECSNRPSETFAIPSTDGLAASSGPGPAVPGYEILGQLGRGGMGIVYKARQIALNRVVALKMLRPGASVTPKKLARFQTEAKAVAQLQHPNIVQIFEIGQHESKPFFSMEFVPGSTLADRLHGETFRPRAAAKLVATLARTVHAVHQCGLVHRDLKPSNVLFTADGTPKITDFGLAKQLDGGGQLTNPGETLGTPGYMAPEQVLGEPDTIGPACDVYALGAILYALLTGRAPFEGESMTVLWETINKAPEPPRQVRSTVPAELEAVCLKCLQKDPGARFASCQDLADDLQRARESRTRQNRAGKTRTQAAAPRTRRRLSRNPMLWSLSAVLIALITMTAIFLSRGSNTVRGDTDGTKELRPATGTQPPPPAGGPADGARFDDRGPPRFPFPPERPRPGLPPQFRPPQFGPPPPPP